MAERPSSPWRRYALVALVTLVGAAGGTGVAQAAELDLFLRHASSDIPIPAGSPSRFLLSPEVPSTETQKDIALSAPQADPTIRDQFESSPPPTHGRRGDALH